MAFEQPLLKNGVLLALADYSLKQYNGVFVNAAGQAALQTTPGAAIVGVIQNKPKLGEAVELEMRGISKALANGVIAAGAQVTADATGFKTGNGTTDKVAGIALDAAAAAGVIFTLLVTAQQ